VVFVVVWVAKSRAASSDPVASAVSDTAPARESIDQMFDGTPAALKTEYGIV